MDRRMFVSSVSSAFLPGAARSAADEVASVCVLRVGDTAPYAYRGADGALTGPAFEMVSEIARELPCQLQPQLSPMVRAFKDLADGGPALLIPPARLPSREALLRWVAPLIPVRLMLFARSDSGHDISTLQAARELELGILSAPGLEESYRAAGFTRLKRVASNEAALRMLMSDRFPALLSADRSVYAALSAAGYARSHVREGAVLSHTALWLAASLSFPDEALRRWQLAAQRRRPQLEKILNRHF